MRHANPVSRTEWQLPGNKPSGFMFSDDINLVTPQLMSDKSFHFACVVHLSPSQIDAAPALDIVGVEDKEHLDRQMAGFSRVLLSSVIVCDMMDKGQWCNRVRPLWDRTPGCCHQECMLWTLLTVPKKGQMKSARFKLYRKSSDLAQMLVKMPLLLPQQKLSIWEPSRLLCEENVALTTVQGWPGISRVQLVPELWHPTGTNDRGDLEGLVFRRGRPHVPGQYTACSFGHIDDRSARSLRTVEESAIVLHVARGKSVAASCRQSPRAREKHKSGAGRSLSVAVLSRGLETKICPWPVEALIQAGLRSDPIPIMRCDPLVLAQKEPQPNGNV
ncbi:hypothetical protein RRG08_020663 [Elysia crispata]|uniref:Uncharacterized protein n=1 Tax=Elysia crispata TaxID=231223 RepID=A0AAE1D9L4_9GAST|nr:hypothetical protein RRG08_020663 [Elysia crispata]